MNNKGIKMHYGSYRQANILNISHQYNNYKSLFYKNKWSIYEVLPWMTQPLLYNFVKNFNKAGHAEELVIYAYRICFGLKSHEGGIRSSYN